MGAAHYINTIGGAKLYSKEAFSSHGIKLSFIKRRRPSVSVTKFISLQSIFEGNTEKNVRLSGEYRIQGKKEKGEIIIKDLSLSGIKFESFRPHQISTDDVL